MLRDLNHACRRLIRTPSYTITAVFCLAVGIGVNTTLFGLVDAMLLRPPAHVRAPHDVMRVGIRTYPDYVEQREQGSYFSALAAFASTSMAILTSAGTTDQLRVASASHTLFPLLGVHPLFGRFFSAAEDRRGGPHVAVLAYSLWQRDFGGRRDVLGERFLIGEAEFTVIGVAPEGFTGLDWRRTELFLPITTTALRYGGRDAIDNRRTKWVSVLARLRPGVTIAGAQMAATQIYRRSDADLPGFDPKATVQVERYAPHLQAMMSTQEIRVSLWLQVVAAIVFLVACANVANLTLARSISRRREFAIRMALGAGIGELVRQVMLDLALVAVLGSVAGLLLAYWGGALLRTLFVTNVAALDQFIDGRVVTFAAATMLLAILLAGLLPALRLARARPASALKTVAGDDGWRRSPVRVALQVGQVAMTLVLLAGAALFIRSLDRVRDIDLGMQTDRILVASLANAGTGGRTAADLDAIFSAMEQAVHRVPGISGTAISSAIPFEQGSFFAAVSSPDRVTPLPQADEGAYGMAVTPGYLGTVGQALRVGRPFTVTDRVGSAPVALVNETLARQLWDGQGALGRCLHVAVDDPPICREVIGVVSDAHVIDVREQPKPEVILPLAQLPSLRPRALLLRAAGAPSMTMLDAVRRTLQESITSTIGLRLRRLDEITIPQFRSWRTGSALFSIFGLLALIIAIVGLFGMLAYDVAQRARELSVRLALGAERGAVAGLIVRRGLGIVLTGVAFGLAAILAGGRWLAPLLYEVSPSDPAILTVVSVLLVVVAVIASYLPARRAARTDPMTVLRAE